MVHLHKQANSLLRSNVNTTKPTRGCKNILSRHIVQLELPETLKATSSTACVVTSESSIGGNRNKRIESSISSSTTKSRRMPMKTDNIGSNCTNKQILTIEATNSGKITKKATTIKTKTKKMYKKTLPKMENLSESSSYCVSQGQVIYEEFWDSDMPQDISSSLSSFSTDYRTPNTQEEDNIKLIGMKNVNYKESKFSGAEETAPLKAPRFVPMSESEKGSNAERIPNTIFKNIALARKSLSSQVFLSSLTPPSDEDVAAYNRKKINERKRMVLNKWLEDNKSDLKTVSPVKRKCYGKTL